MCIITYLSQSQYFFVYKLVSFGYTNLGSQKGGIEKIMHQGTRIKEARLAKGMSQNELATALGVSKPTISRYELGQRHLQLDQLKAISKILDIPIIELVELEPEKREELEKAMEIIVGIQERELEGQYLGDGDQWINSIYTFLKHLIDQELGIATASDEPQNGEALEISTPKRLTPEQIRSKKRMKRLGTIFELLDNERQLKVIEYVRDMYRSQNCDSIMPDILNSAEEQNSDD